jgi:hypothetical protein
MRVVSICMILPRVLGSCLVSVLVNVNRCYSNEPVPCFLHPSPITLRMLSETGRGSGGRDSGGCPMNLEMGPNRALLMDLTYQIQSPN